MRNSWFLLLLGVLVLGLQALKISEIGYADGVASTRSSDAGHCKGSIMGGFRALIKLTGPMLDPINRATIVFKDHAVDSIKVEVPLSGKGGL